MNDAPLSLSPSDPNAPVRACPHCRRLVRTRSGRCPECGGPLAAGSLRRAATARLPTFWLTYGLLASFILLFVVAGIMEIRMWAHLGRGVGEKGMEVFWQGAGYANLTLGSAFEYAISVRGQYWRWVTACFLHFGVIHILFNGMAFMDLGRLCEMIWGRRRMWAVFILTGAAGNVFSHGWRLWRPYLWDRWVTGAASGVPYADYLNTTLKEQLAFNGAGASGAICGLIGLLLAAWVRKRGIPEVMGKGLVRSVVYILVFGLIISNIDNAAHIGGGLAGFALGWFMPPLRWTRPDSAADRVWTALAVACAVLFLACCVAAVHAHFHQPLFDFPELPESPDLPGLPDGPESPTPPAL